MKAAHTEASLSEAHSSAYAPLMLLKCYGSFKSVRAYSLVTKSVKGKIQTPKGHLSLKSA